MEYRAVKRVSQPEARHPPPPALILVFFLFTGTLTRHAKNEDEDAARIWRISRSWQLRNDAILKEKNPLYQCSSQIDCSLYNARHNRLDNPYTDTNSISIHLNHLICQRYLYVSRVRTCYYCFFYITIKQKCDYNMIPSFYSVSHLNVSEI